MADSLQADFAPLVAKFKPDLDIIFLSPPAGKRPGNSQRHLVENKWLKVTELWRGEGLAAEALGKSSYLWVGAQPKGKTRGENH